MGAPQIFFQVPNTISRYNFWRCGCFDQFGPLRPTLLLALLRKNKHVFNGFVYRDSMADLMRYVNNLRDDFCICVAPGMPNYARALFVQW